MFSRLTYLLLLLCAATSLSAQVENGYVDLTAHSFEAHGYTLHGRWEFYWNQLLAPTDLAKAEPTLLFVPGSWHRQGNYSTLGFGTYRLRMRMSPQQQGLAIYFPIINSSAKVWINGTLVNESGKVGRDPDNYRPRLLSTVVPIPDRTDTVELVMQVANFTYFSGGIAGYPRLHYAHALFEDANRRNGVENFFAGSLIALFIYQVILYFLFHRGKPYLWLALICLGVALRALIVNGGSFLLPNLFPDIHWEWWKKIEFGSVYAICGLFPLYIYHLFPAFAPRKPLYFFVGIASLLFAAVLITPQYMYGQLLEVCHLTLLLAFIYAIFSVARAWRTGDSDARIILFGVLASFPFILMEILKNSQLFPINIGFMYLVELGVLVFLLFQVYLLANHYAKAYRNLESMNINLEKMVTERTSQLQTANSVKDRLLSVISHDIKSPLNSLRGILQLYNKGAISPSEFNTFAQQVEGDLHKTNLLVDNILFWTASQLKGMQVKKEKFEAQRVVQEHIDLFSTIARNKKVSLRCDAQDDTLIYFDRNIFNLVLRNFLSNAIKFSNEGGDVTIRLRRQPEFFQVTVSDQGVGMDADTLQSLQNIATTVSKEGTTHEKGTGMGIALCREFLLKAGGSLEIKSAKGEGSSFSMLIPS